MNNCSFQIGDMVRVKDGYTHNSLWVEEMNKHIGQVIIRGISWTGNYLVEFKRAVYRDINNKIIPCWAFKGIMLEHADNQLMLFKI